MRDNPTDKITDITSATIIEHASENELRFNALADEWYESTRAHSSIALKAIHPAYQQIIGMGPDALPFIFKRLRTGKGHWFCALTAITGEMPVLEEDLGHVAKMRKDWIQWGKQHGYVDSLDDQLQWIKPT